MIPENDFMYINKDIIKSQGFSKFFKWVDTETKVRFDNIDLVLKQVALLNYEADIALINESK